MRFFYSNPSPISAQSCLPDKEQINRRLMLKLLRWIMQSIIKQILSINNSGMNNIINNLASAVTTKVIRPLRNYVSTPIGKITLANSTLFMLWNLKGLSESFLVEHFAFQRINLASNRLYTAITYSFSHLSSLHFALNMLALQLVGRRVQLRYGSRYVWGLYLAGACAGSLAMNYLMPYDTIQLPKVGADPCISAFFSFLAVQNPKLAAFNLIVPIRLWFLLAAGTAFVLVSDSSFKNLGGLAMGAGLGLLRRRFLL